MNERDYQALIVELARSLGYKVVHHMPGKTAGGRWTTPTTEIGWPDLTLIRPPRIIFAELKGNRTPLRPGQAEFLAELDSCGLEAYLWRAGETSLQDVADILARKAAPDAA